MTLEEQIAVEQLSTELDNATMRIVELEAALTEASTMKLHWSSRGKQKKFREMLERKVTK